jgi:hypothetical protein
MHQSTKKEPGSFEPVFSAPKAPNLDVQESYQVEILVGEVVKGEKVFVPPLSFDFLLSFHLNSFDRLSIEVRYSRAKEKPMSTAMLFSSQSIATTSIKQGTNFITLRLQNKPKEGREMITLYFKLAM